MSQEDELVELNRVYQATAEQNEELRALVADYDAYLQQIAPFTHKDGAKAKALRARAKVLGIEGMHE